MEAGTDLEVVISVQILMLGHPVVVDHNTSGMNLIIIPDPLRNMGDHHLIIVKKRCAFHNLHLVAVIIHHNKNTVHIVRGCTEPQGQVISDCRLRRRTVILRTVTEKCSEVQDRC